MSDYSIVVEENTYTAESSDSEYVTIEVQAEQGPQGATGATGPQGPQGDPGDPAPSDHTLLSNIGTNTHAQIDTHIANTSNPHSVTKAQVGLGNADNTSDLNKPISTATQTALDLKVDENAAIVGATKTKITYDAKGLVTAGADATTADIADSTNRRYVTDADLVDIGNLSGTNTGDQTITLTGDVTGSGTGSFAATLNKTAITGKSAVGPLTSDYLLISDTSDTGNLKKVLVNDILGLVDFSSYVPYTGATNNVDLGAFALQTGTIKDGSAVDSVKTTSRQLLTTLGLVSADWEAGLLNSPSDESLVIDLVNRTLNSPDEAPRFSWASNDLPIFKLNGTTSGFYFEGGSAPYIQFDTSSDAMSTGNATRFIFNNSYVSMSILEDGSSVTALNLTNRTLSDGGGTKAIEFTASQRQLFDSSGSYPSVDFGNYGLWNVGITNNGPLVDWSNASGGVRIYSYYGGGYHNSGDFVNYILNNPAGPTLDWAQRLCYDNTSAVSIDWDYHTLSSSAAVSIDWQNKYLYSDSFGGVIAIDYGAHLLNNGGGFLSIDFSNHTLYDQTGSSLTLDYHQRACYDSGAAASINWESYSLSAVGVDTLLWGSRQLIDSSTNVVLDWTTQQTTAITGATIASGTGGNVKHDDTFDGYTIDQVVAALRAYGLLA